ncbi:serine hydrolase [Halobacteriovorax sp. GB3]|uniref:serine hydrolase domain-containing protein n=1 Tax=Halobacteriovorax sp. GB3 TaxID=2719615 RepID=UPI0023624FAE|nr:serine hydrolase domain-containing protein [Halobacteriovorax sp. GB3]MDD0852018.1 serine hydrolase [Halobacteriovorax sp. GB3]
MNSYFSKEDSFFTSAIITNGFDILEEHSLIKDEAYCIGSLTKTFIAVAMLILEEKKLIDIKGNLHDYIPEFNKLTDTKVPIKVEHLLNHTSGLITQSKININSREELVKLLNYDKIQLKINSDDLYEPGRHFHYSNLAYAYLGILIEVVSKQKLEDFLNEHILNPLNMKRTTISSEHSSKLRTGHMRYKDKQIPVPIESFGYYRAAGGMISTISDLKKWMAFLLYNTNNLLKEEQFKKLFNFSKIDHDFTKITGLALYQTLNKESHHIGHHGKTGGFSTFFGLLEDHKLGVIILSNTSSIDLFNIGCNIVRDLRIQNMTIEEKKILNHLKVLLPIINTKSKNYRSLFSHAFINAVGGEEKLYDQLIFEFHKNGQINNFSKCKKIGPNSFILETNSKKQITIYFSEEEYPKLDGIYIN